MTKLRTMDGAIVNRRYRSSGQLVQKRVARQVVALAPLARHVSPGHGIAEGEPRSGRRRPPIVRVRRLLCQVAVQGRRYSGAGVAPHLGVTTSAGNRVAVSGELPEIRRYLTAL
jgi:hypothetical protein